MDLDFFRRHRSGLATGAPAGLDYGMLVAALAAMQSSSAAARAELRAAAPDPSLAPSRRPLAELLLGGPGWREAIAALAGRFNPAQAALRGNRM